MEVKQLINELSNWPKDAQVEVAIPVMESNEPEMEDKVWREVSMVEEVNPDPRDDNKHCLLFAGKITIRRKRQCT